MKWYSHLSLHKYIHWLGFSHTLIGILLIPRIIQTSLIKMIYYNKDKGVTEPKGRNEAGHQKSETPTLSRIPSGISVIVSSALYVCLLCS